MASTYQAEETTSCLEVETQINHTDHVFIKLLRHSICDDLENCKKLKEFARKFCGLIKCVMTQKVIPNLPFNFI